MSIETGGPAKMELKPYDQEREAFEHYFSDAGAWPATIRRDENGGGYLLQSAACAWEVWQARARLDQECQGKEESNHG